MTDALASVVETPAVDAAAAAEATSGVVPAGSAATALPRVIVEAGPRAVGKFVEFFGGSIANERTRAAYARAAGQFLGWCEGRGLRLEAVEPLHVAAYIRTHPGVGADREAAPGRDPHALRLARRQPSPPGEPRRCRPGPEARSHQGGNAHILSLAEARNLLEHIETGAVAGMLDRALLSVMLYRFARISAVLGMRRGSGTTCRLTTARRQPSTSTSRRPNSRSRRLRSSRASTPRVAG